MAKKQEFLTTNQGDLFQQLPEHVPTLLSENAPPLDLRDEFMGMIKMCMREAKKQYGLHTQQIVERMNLCLAEKDQITLRQFNGWTAQSAEFREFPAIFLPAFLWACKVNIYAPFKLLAESIDLHVTEEREKLALELGETVVAKTRLAEIERELRGKLGRNK